ncbi:MAG: ribosome small subunit-dependent GTPase A [Deltaproteobacteria bacterium]|nr:ribosome small subunit-dependent GTPase A [Deltaproteobacteria bacterium]
MSWSFDLEDLGFRRTHAEDLAALEDSALIPLRVIEVHRKTCAAIGPQGEVAVTLSKRVRHTSASTLELPAVGDWIAVRAERGEHRLEATLARTSLLARRTANAEPQALAANVDVAFIVGALNKELNVRRMERYLALALEGGAEPVVVLNKSDLVDDPDELVALVKAQLGDVQVVAVSATGGVGIEALSRKLERGVTAVFLGSSGVGKSSLVNRLLGNEALLVGEVRSWDDRGRHTTSRRQLIPTRTGLLVDTPGLREVEPWAAAHGVAATFPEIDERLGSCRFSDCQHESEPGCAVLEAVEAGEIQSERFESWRKLQQQQAEQGPWRGPKAGTRTPRMRKS